MKKAYFIIPLLAITVVIFLLVFLNRGNNSIKTDTNNNGEESDLQDQETQRDETSNIGDSIDPNNNEISPQESDGGSGGEAGGGELSPITGCTISQSSYSLENIQINQVCNAYSGQICIDKTITCSIEINNLDFEIKGNFNLEMFFVEAGKLKSDALEARNSEFIIDPGEFQLYEETLNIQGSGENDPSNKEITCFYNTLETPRREIC